MFLTLASLFPDRAGVGIPVHPCSSAAGLTRSGHSPAKGTSSARTAIFRGILPDDVLDASRPPDAASPTNSWLRRASTWAAQRNGAARRGRRIRCPPRLWHHLIYAYLLESTGMLEIFAEVLRRLVIGETLGTLPAASISWARATEQLFFREPPDFSIVGVISEVRPLRADQPAQRLLADVRYGPGSPGSAQWARRGPLAEWKAYTGAVNSDFRQKWNELLRQVWLASRTRDNETGAKLRTRATSPCSVQGNQGHARQTSARRGVGARGVAYVSMLSWFHLTVDRHADHF